jgi:hypothetical protein
MIASRRLSPNIGAGAVRQGLDAIAQLTDYACDHADPALTIAR